MTATGAGGGSRLRPTRKAWKFFLSFFLIVGISFIAVEYSMSYYIINGISLQSPLNTTRWSEHAGDTNIWTIKFCLLVPIVSQSVPADFARSLFGLSSDLTENDFSMVANSYSLVLALGPGYGGLGSCAGLPTPSGILQFWGLQFGTYNQTVVKALNSTVTTSLTLSMRGNFRTYVYSQQITRSTAVSCNFGPIFLYAPQPNTCGTP